jgi:hypothetical protein
MVDAMLVHHYPQAYDAATAGTGCCRARGGRGTLAGLRFVRNRIGGQADLAGFIKPGAAGAGPSPRTYHGLGMEDGAGTGARVAWAPRAGVGGDAVPGLPGSPGRPHHRRDLRAGRGFVQLAAADAAQITDGQESLAGRHWEAYS